VRLRCLCIVRCFDTGSYFTLVTRAQKSCAASPSLSLRFDPTFVSFGNAVHSDPNMLVIVRPITSAKLCTASHTASLNMSLQHSKRHYNTVNIHTIACSADRNSLIRSAKSIVDRKTSHSILRTLLRSTDKDRMLANGFCGVRGAWTPRIVHRTTSIPSIHRQPVVCIVPLL